MAIGGVEDDDDLQWHANGEDEPNRFAHPDGISVGELYGECDEEGPDEKRDKDNPCDVVAPVEMTGLDIGDDDRPRDKPNEGLP